MSVSRRHCPLHARRHSHRTGGFTLLEIIVSMVVVVTAMLVVVKAMSRVQDTWKTTSDKVRQAQDARAGFETLSRTLVRATLDSRWTANDASDPSFLQRESDLHFVCGPVSDLIQNPGAMCGHAVFFQAPNGYTGPDDRTTSSSEKAQYDTLPGVLNAWGWFVEFGTDPAQLPAFVSGERRTQKLAPLRYRFRLMEFRQPAHELALFQMQGTDQPKARLALASTRQDLYKWFNDPLAHPTGSTERRCAVIAENVLALVMEPFQQGEPVDASSGAAGPVVSDPTKDYVHDSRRFQWDPAGTRSATTRHALPAALKVTLVVLDDRDWEKMTDEEAQHAGSELRSQVTGRFKLPSSFASDLGSITGELNRRHMKHREITTTIPLPGARWTTDRETH